MGNVWMVNAIFSSENKNQEPKEPKFALITN